ncbi:hypothetical protein M199_gp166 [Halogranum tailed virus 1]|uniref:Uncharacterized protein n=1 Tax=Halogranum tailed virus 1 TaxID=1273749 RepID=R4T9B1_9CAUD|nr:hypothetical protein M199_gp166 [Halogranum tailed virus 1]AGM11500.1 hypothetical protein HGTV1_203 [Halogranum tailed virus 1]
MSSEQDAAKTDDEFAQYRSTAGAEVKTADVASDTHPLKAEIGDQKERIYDAKIAGERFVQFYDDSAAAIREYLSNAETACIRRARHELLDAGVSEQDIPSNVADLIEMAQEVAGYEPLIEVTYNRKSDETRLVIEDNGIGISVEEYQVLQRIGYSTSHGNGERLGQFGMGFMSGFQLTSIHGAFRMFTRSYLTEEAYSTVEYVANCEYLDGAPETYGTRFEFPEFGEAAKEIHIPAKVAEYAEGMRVPVLYRDFNSSGQETAESDDFLPRNIEDDYSDDSLVVTFENDYFKAVMSPDKPTNRPNSHELVTYNVTMPIRRNLDSWSTNDKFEAPWKWDFRGKKEDGPIVKCESDASVEGLVPVENSKYDNMIQEQQAKHLPMSDVPDDAIVMPGPASSRDSYMGGHDDFWKYVSECLNEAWAEIAKERFENLSSWDDFKALERDEKNALYRAYSQFGPSYGTNDPDNIQETLEDAFGVTVPKDVCEKIDKSRKSLMVVPRGHNQAHHKKPAKRNKKKIWQIIDEAPDGVYMGKSVSQKKAEIAWGLGDTHVIRIQPDDGQTSKERYAELEELWGFKKLKDLPNSKLKERLPNLDDDVAEEWENADYVNNTSSSGGRRTSRDPTTKRIKVRVGKRSHRYFSRSKVSYIVDQLENDDGIRAGNYTVKKLIIYDQTKVGSTPSTRHADKYGEPGIAVAAVPKYVYNYLKDKKNVYTDYDSLKDELVQDELDEYDNSETLIFASSEVFNEYESNEQELVSLLNEHSDAGLNEDADIEVYSTSDAKNISHAQGTDFNAKVVSVNGNRAARGLSEADYKLNLVDLKFAREVPEMDFDAPEFKQVFGRKKYLDADSAKMNRGIEIVKACGGKWPSQQD